MSKTYNDRTCINSDVYFYGWLFAALPACTVKEVMSFSRGPAATAKVDDTVFLCCGALPSELIN